MHTKINLGQWLLVLWFFISGGASQASELLLSPQLKTKDLKALKGKVQELIEDNTCGRNDQILVALDIDDTILASGDFLGSMAAEKTGFIDWEFRHYRRIFGTQMLTQVDTADIIHSFQEMGVKVMAMTARGSDEYHNTLRELNRYGVYFSQSAPRFKKSYLDSFPPVKSQLNQRASDYSLGGAPRIIEGVYMGAHNKGEQIKEVIEGSTDVIECVLFADDSNYYRSFERAFPKAQHSKRERVWFYLYTGLYERRVRAKEADSAILAKRVSRAERVWLDKLFGYLKSEMGLYTGGLVLNIFGEPVGMDYKEESVPFSSQDKEQLFKSH